MLKLNESKLVTPQTLVSIYTIKYTYIITYMHYLFIHSLKHFYAYLFMSIIKHIKFLQLGIFTPTKVERQ